MDTVSVTTTSPLKPFFLLECLCLWFPIASPLWHCHHCFSLRSNVTVAIARYNKMMEKQGQTLSRTYWTYVLTSQGLCRPSLNLCMYNDRRIKILVTLSPIHNNTYKIIITITILASTPTDGNTLFITFCHLPLSMLELFILMGCQCVYFLSTGGKKVKATI